MEASIRLNPRNPWFNLLDSTGSIGTRWIINQTSAAYETNTKN
jgi:hypothetical protein